jgi:DNA polymerase III subunit delta
MPELVYLYHGRNDFLLNHVVEEKIKSLEVDPFNIIKYDLLENTSDDVIEDLQTVSFFADRKVIVVYHLEAVLNEAESLHHMWANYLAKPNPDVTLIIVLNELISKQTVVGDALKKFAYIEKVEDIDQAKYPEFVMNYFVEKGYTIEQKAAITLIERTGNDYQLMATEADKLMIFAYEQKYIQEEDVLSLVSRNLEENIFELTNALLSRNQYKTIEIFYDLIARNEDPLRILNNISSKIKELMQAKIMVNQGYNQEQLAEHFKISSGRAFYLLKNAKAITLDLLEKHLEKLAQLDYEIKAGQKDKKLGVELYLLGA